MEVFETEAKGAGLPVSGRRPTVPRPASTDDGERGLNHGEYWNQSTGRAGSPTARIFSSSWKGVMSAGS
jgi:hypothetical protein